MHGPRISTKMESADLKGRCLPKRAHSLFKIVFSPRGLGINHFSVVFRLLSRLPSHSGALSTSLLFDRVSVPVRLALHQVFFTFNLRSTPGVRWHMERQRACIPEAFVLATSLVLL